MCFYNDYDWHASVQIAETKVATKEMRCEECGARISIGEEYYDVFQQEHEDCQRCFDLDCDCPKDEDGDCIDCKCGKPDYGEQFTYHSCLNCKKFRDAIKAAEKEEGCPADALQPALASMVEDISMMESDDARKYFDTAIRMYPELKQSDYLDSLWRRMFGAAAV